MDFTVKHIIIWMVIICGSMLVIANEYGLFKHFSHNRYKEDVPRPPITHYSAY